MNTSRFRQAVILLAILVSHASCATAPDAKLSPDDPNSSRDSQTAIVAEDLNVPWSITFYGQTPLVSERSRLSGAAGEAGLVDPVQQWRPADASPSGMAIPAGSSPLRACRVASRLTTSATATT